MPPIGITPSFQALQIAYVNMIWNIALRFDMFAKYPPDVILVPIWYPKILVPYLNQQSTAKQHTKKQAAILETSNALSQIG